MPLSAGSCLLTEMSWVDVEEHIAHDGRLIVPVGACDQYGPHLPLGAGTLVAEAVAATLARDFGVLRAPTLAYGVNLPTPRHFPGAAGLNEKTLRRALNDLLACWEDHGFTEFVLITAHRHDPHIDAIATATVTTARIRAVELLGIDLSRFREGPAGPEHGGEILTSLMLHLYPHLVDLDRATDFGAPGADDHPARPLSSLPPDSPGLVGHPGLATAEKGRLVFEHLLELVRAKVFLTTHPDDEP